MDEDGGRIAGRGHREGSCPGDADHQSDSLACHGADLVAEPLQQARETEHDRQQDREDERCGEAPRERAADAAAGHEVVA